MKRLTVVFDVDGLTDEQIDILIGEVVCQAEANDDHPDVDVASVETPDGTVHRGGLRWVL